MKKVILILVTLLSVTKTFSQLATVNQQIIQVVRCDTSNARLLSIEKAGYVQATAAGQTANTASLAIAIQSLTTINTNLLTRASGVQADSSLARELAIKKLIDSVRMLTRTLNTRLLTINNSVATNSAVIITSGSVTGAAGNNHIGQIGSNETTIINTITTSTTAYSSGDNIGGINSATAAIRVSGSTATLIDLTVWDKENQKPAITIDFWSSSPSSGTYTDNAAEVIFGDQSRYLGSVSVASADYITTGIVARANIKNIITTLKSSDTIIYYTITTTSTPTYSTTSGLLIGLGIKQD
jgi:hypothetical protein